jgi:hypothetical protein
MIKRRDDPMIVTLAIEQMVSLIKVRARSPLDHAAHRASRRQDLIKMSVGDLYYSKALLCVLALRAGCVKVVKASIARSV